VQANREYVLLVKERAGKEFHSELETTYPHGNEVSLMLEQQAPETRYELSNHTNVK